MSLTSVDRVCVAWHGLPFYAAQCLMELKSAWPDGVLSIIGSRAQGAAIASPLDARLGINWIDETLPRTFGALGLPIPAILFKTSWHHVAFESLACEVRRAGGAVVILADNTFSWRPRKILGMAYSRLFIVPNHWGVFVPGKEARRFMRLLGFPAERIYEKLYCTNPVFFRAGRPIRPRKLLYVGRFEAEKNVVNLLEAWKLYRASGGLQTELHFVGSGRVRLMADHAAGVKVTNWSSQEDIRDLMREYSSFVLPSRRDHWGVVMLEAALSGCILVGSKQAGATSDLIAEGENGVVIKSPTVAAIATALHAADTIISSPEREQRARQISRETGENYSVQRFVESMERIVEATRAIKTSA